MDITLKFYRYFDGSGTEEGPNVMVEELAGKTDILLIPYHPEDGTRITVRFLLSV